VWAARTGNGVAVGYLSVSPLRGQKRARLTQLQLDVRNIHLRRYCHVPVVVTETEVVPATTFAVAIGESSPVAPMEYCETVLPVMFDT
jgi:hypothetical protein